MKTVLVTGAGGFISRHVAHELRKAGCRIIGTSHTRETFDGFDLVLPGALGTTLLDVFDREPIDCVVHCAYHPDKNSEDEFRVNVSGTISWADQAQNSGVKTQIFLSSLSARDNVTSAYGRSKREIEKWFVENNQIVFRLGLVVGNGGIFGRLVGTVQKYPVIPLLDNGTAPVYPMGINYLCQVIRDSVVDNGEGRKGRTWHLQQPESVLLREVLSTIRSVLHKRCIFVPIPSILVLSVVDVVEKLHIKGLQISGNNIRGLRASYQAKFPSDFELFGYKSQSLYEMVSQAIHKPNLTTIESGLK